MGTHGEGTIVARQGIGVSTKHPAAIDAAKNENGETDEEKKKEFSEYVGINKNIHEYLIAKRNLEMLYRQEQSKNEKEGRDKRTRNSRTESVL